MSHLHQARRTLKRHSNLINTSVLSFIFYNTFRDQNQQIPNQSRGFLSYSRNPPLTVQQQRYADLLTPLSQTEAVFWWGSAWHRTLLRGAAAQNSSSTTRCSLPMNSTKKTPAGGLLVLRRPCCFMPLHY